MIWKRRVGWFNERAISTNRVRKCSFVESSFAKQEEELVKRKESCERKEEEERLVTEGLSKREKDAIANQ